MDINIAHFYWLKGKEVKFSLWFLTDHHTMKGYWGCRGVAPCILNLCTKWSWMVSFTPMLVYPQGKRPCYPLDRRLGGPQSQPRCSGEEKKSHPMPGLEPPIIQPVTQCYSTELSRLLLSLTNEKLSELFSIVGHPVFVQFISPSSVIQTCHVHLTLEQQFIVDSWNFVFKNIIFFGKI
jgi:hypothetical protein